MMVRLERIPRQGSEDRAPLVGRVREQAGRHWSRPRHRCNHFGHLPGRVWGGLQTGLCGEALNMTPGRSPVPRA